VAFQQYNPFLKRSGAFWQHQPPAQRADASLRLAHP
jgi:hypothetical protein